MNADSFAEMFISITTTRYDSFWCCRGILSLVAPYDS
jgi:hypothetical protein